MSVSDADKQKLENLRLEYVKAQETNSPNLEQAREAYQDLATKLLIQLSGKFDFPPGPDPGSDPGYVKPGGWGANPDPNGWKVVNMKDQPAMFKVVDDAGKNIATNFKTKEGAQAYVDKAKAGGACPPGQHFDPASQTCVVNAPAPAGDKDQFGILKICKDKAGGETNTNFKPREMTRHYASGKPSEESFEYTAEMSGPAHNSDVEQTFYEKINGFKSSADTISDKATGPDHQDGAKSWVIAEFATDGSSKTTYETETPHPKYQKIDPKPATSIGGSLVGQWFGHKHITYVKDGKRYVNTWVHYPVKDINNIAAEQDGWREYVKTMEVGSGFTQARGTLNTSRLDGIKKGDPPDFKYCSVREIEPPA
jgi:hypothetical protein